MTQTVTPPMRPVVRRPVRVPPQHRRWLVSGLALLCALGLWALAAVIVDDPILPNPADVVVRVMDIIASGEAFTNFAASIAKIAAGFAIAMVAGLLIGFTMGRSRFMTAYFSLPLFVLGNMPGLTYAVFGLLIFGVGSGGPVVVSALVATPFIAINVAEGVRSVAERRPGNWLGR